MSMSKKGNDALRTKFVGILKDVLSAAGEEVLITGTNEICIPTVDAEGEDQYVVFTVKVPTGSRDGDAYDGYSMQQDFAIKQKNKAEKAKKDAKDKAAKIARDTKMRASKAKLKAERAVSE